MTRINAFIPPADLCDKHLLAEHREIIRIPNQIKNNKLSSKNQPQNFTLGTGHVKFFRDKLKFLHKRYIILYDECKLRGFNVQNYNTAFNDLPIELYKEYKPSNSEIDRIKSTLIERINIRMPKNAKRTKYDNVTL